jgi:hypothetical protein
MKGPLDSDRLERSPTPKGTMRMQGKKLGWLGSGVLVLGLMLTMDCTSASANFKQLIRIPAPEVTQNTGGTLPDRQLAPSLFGAWQGTSVYSIKTSTETIRQSLPVYTGKPQFEQLYWFFLWLLWKFDVDIFDTSIDQEVNLQDYPITVTSTPMEALYINHLGQTVVSSRTTYDFGPLGKFVTEDILLIKQVATAPAFWTVEGNKTLIYGLGTGIFRTATGNLNVGPGMGLIKLILNGAARDLREEGPFEFIHYSGQLP